MNNSGEGAKVQEIPLTRWQKKASLWLFIMGVFSATQVYIFGCIGISEIVVFAIAPYIYWQDYKTLHQDGFMPFFCLVFLNMVGCVVASTYYGARPIIIIKGLMTLYSMFAITVVFHRLLRGNYYGLRWFLLGTVVSGIIKPFGFNPKITTSSTRTIVMETEDIETQMAHPLFWTGRLTQLLNTIVTGWYWHLPIIVGYIGLFLSALIITSVTVSGRAAIGVSFAGLILLTIAGKRRSGLLRLRKHIVMLFCGMILIALSIKVGYVALVRSGALGEQAISKYERQTRSGSGLLDFVRSGRAEFFIGLTAIIENPILGYGVIPIDDNGYVEKYFAEHATIEDYENLLRFGSYNDIDGVRLIPSHSHIIGFWISNGIFGLILWVYILKILFDYYRYTIDSLPQVFPFVCFMTPSIVWSIFFNPYTGRFGIPLLVTCILSAKAAWRSIPVSDPVDMGLVDGYQR